MAGTTFSRRRFMAATALLPAARAMPIGARPAPLPDGDDRSVARAALIYYRGWLVSAEDHRRLTASARDDRSDPAPR
jgi:hypothetical protein